MHRREMVMGNDGLAPDRLRGDNGRFVKMHQAKAESKEHVLTVHDGDTPTTGGGRCFGGGEVWVLVRVWRFLKSTGALRQGPGEQEKKAEPTRALP
jgi:hypothetical protein